MTIAVFLHWTVQCTPIEMASLDLERRGRFDFSQTTPYFERVAMLAAIRLYSVLYQSSNSVSIDVATKYDCIVIL